ncbi:F-box family protein [Melia azedarach]|uniref:F-box family protein n=1 Tax=Melia azedarach TaxID=155640 RepID=A0ACC1YP48_MELAZ|nr:F-box family protein [Melia azedarach]
MSSSSSDDHGGGTNISTVHQDIIQTHILTRLDGPTLAATACASSQLRALSSFDQLWRHICTATWPSINHENVARAISTFPSGHRSFFSDSFPVLDHRQPSKHSLDHSSILTTELIFCVDIYYKNSLVISKAQVIETVTGWFWCSPFRVDLFDPEESVSSPFLDLHGGRDDTWLEDLEENLSMSWILIDPSQKRAVNLSSGRAVSVERHWLTGRSTGEVRDNRGRRPTAGDGVCEVGGGSHVRRKRGRRGAREGGEHASGGHGRKEFEWEG